MTIKLIQRKDYRPIAAMSQEAPEPVSLEEKLSPTPGELASAIGTCVDHGEDYYYNAWMKGKND